MGQYYRILMKRDGKIMVNAREIEGHDYVMAKLMEHSYLGHSLMRAVAAELEKGPMRLAWVGDYANQGGDSGDGDDVSVVTNGEVTFNDVWNDAAIDESVANGGKVSRIVFPSVKSFKYAGKLFVNYTKEEYVDFDAYIKMSLPDNPSGAIAKKRLVDWCVSPVSLLTAVGNDSGGGDYRSVHPNYAKVGRWAWDEVEIIDGQPPQLFKKLNIYFKD